MCCACETQWWVDFVRLAGKHVFLIFFSFFLPLVLVKIACCPCSDVSFLRYFVCLSVLLSSLLESEFCGLVFQRLL